MRTINCLIKTPGLITPPLFKKKFSDLKHGLITPFWYWKCTEKISHLIRICDGEVGVISSSYILAIISAITWLPFHRFIYVPWKYSMLWLLYCIRGKQMITLCIPIECLVNIVFHLILKIWIYYFLEWLAWRTIKLFTTSIVLWSDKHILICWSSMILCNDFSLV